MTLPKIITSYQFFDALCKAGVLDREQYSRASRIVIDAKQGDVVVVHIEMYADETWLKVIPTLEGIEITREPKTDSATQDGSQQDTPEETPGLP